MTIELKHSHTNEPFVIGVSGGSGSGKTTISKEIFDRLSEDSVVMITQDSYYKSQDGVPMEQRVLVNYDHPDAFDTALMIEQVRALMNGETVEVPSYDYEQHTRSDKTTTVHPSDVIILEGVLLFTDANMRDLFDIKLYVDTDDDVRFIRRMQRDVVERGRTVDSVVDQYMATVKPMYHQFVEPTKRYADVIVPEGGANKVGISMIEAQIRSILSQKNI